MNDPGCHPSPVNYADSLERKVRLKDCITREITVSCFIRLGYYMVGLGFLSVFISNKSLTNTY